MDILIAWLGRHDLRAARAKDAKTAGPLADFIALDPHARVVLLNPEGLAAAWYPEWLAGRTGCQVEMIGVPLARAHDLDAVYEEARRTVVEAAGHWGQARFSYLVSAGTKAMSTALLWVGCLDPPGRIFHNRADPRQDDPRQRCVQLSWPARFSGALVAGRRLAGETDAALLDASAREVSRDPAMREIYRRAARVSPSALPVLISGEVGTGKNILARFILGQNAQSLDGPTADAADMEALTGAAVLVETVGALHPAAQHALLGLLRRGPTRVVATATGDLWESVRGGRFREDLYFELSRYRMHLPPLRDRPQDVRFIAESVLAVDAAARGQITTLDDDAWLALAKHLWPGNVRELRNAMTQLVVDAVETESGRVVTSDLVARVLDEGPADKPSVAAPQPIGSEPGEALVAAVRRTGQHLQEVMERWEAAAIQHAISLEKTQKSAGELLGYSPQNMSNTKRRLQARGYWKP